MNALQTIKSIIPSPLRPVAKSAFRTIADLNFKVIRKSRISSYPMARHLRAIIRDRQIDCIFDVGANAGQYGRFLRREVGYKGRIVSFEPVPATFAELTNTAAGDAAWQVFPLALGSAATTLPINVTAASVFSSFRKPADNNLIPVHNETAYRIDVPVMTLDGFLAEHEIAFERAYLKLDTQGFDLEVLAGSAGTLPRVEAIQSEVSFVQLYDDMPAYDVVFRALNGKGFRLSGMYPVTLSNCQAVEFDCIAVRERPFTPGLHNSYDDVILGRPLKAS